MLMSLHYYSRAQVFHLVSLQRLPSHEDDLLSGFGAELLGGRAEHLVVGAIDLDLKERSIFF